MGYPRIQDEAITGLVNTSPKLEVNEGHIKSRLDQLGKELDHLEGLLKITWDKVGPIMLYPPPRETRPEVPCPVESNLEGSLRHISCRLEDISETVNSINSGIRL